MGRWTTELIAALLFVVVAGPAPAQTTADVSATAPALEKNLTANILAFWFPGSLDREHGGFLIDHGPDGKFRGAAPKALVTQARMVWLASRLVRDGRGGPAMREAADHGYRFLMERMWDRESGGFYWEVDRAGTTVVHPHKHLYGQAFGLYALAEYARATGSAAARDDARRLFALIEEKAYDRQYGGYREFFARDWGPPPPDARPYLGGTADLKLMNTHLHLMEALTTLYHADPTPAVAARLSELVTIQSNAVVRKAVGACTDQYERNWTPRLDAAAARASYGHDLENIWLLVDAIDALGQPVAPFVDLFRQLFDYSLRHGYDHERGGFYDSGPLGADADRRDKVWWVQAEALVSALTMFKLTRESKYADVYLKTWAFTNTAITDWTTGEWHGAVSPDGRASGDKANRWKAGYHNGRAMIEALRLVGELRTEAADVTTVPLPGGVEGIRRALGDRVAMSPAMAIADLTRRFYNGTDVATDRDAGFARLQAWLREAETTPPATLPPDRVPLPGSPGFWHAAGVGAAPDRLALAILGNRSAALLYTALLSMDPVTRAWFLERPDVVGRLSESDRGALVVAAPYLRLEDGAWRLPGGAHVQPVWADMVGASASDTPAFLVALVGTHAALVPYMAEVIATLSAGQQVAALGGMNAGDEQRRAAGRALLASLKSAVESWQPGERPFWRPSTDAAFLLAQIGVDGRGGLALPGGRKFWQEALAGDEIPALDEARAAPSSVEGRDAEPLAASWLVARLAAAAPEDQPLVYQQILFAARTMGGLSVGDAPSALTVIRGYARFPPLLRSMERIGVTGAARMAAMVRQAHALTRAGDDWRARATLIQWQCAIALVERVVRAGTMSAAEAAAAIDTLAAPIRAASEPAWAGWLGAVAGVSARHADVESRAIERAVLDRLTTVKVPGERRIQWEGTSYRVDFSAAERDRVSRVRGRDGRPLLDAAGVLAGWAARASSMTQDQALPALASVVAAAGVDRLVDADNELGRLAREAATKARRQLAEGGRADSALPAIEDLREALATSALIELVYAVHMGWADDLPLSAAAASRRHVFVKPFGPGRNRLWTAPAINTDRRFPWHVAGSALGLDVALAPVAMRRLSLRPLVASPLLNTGDRAVLVTTAVVIDPRVFTVEVLDAMRALTSRAQARLDEVAGAGDARQAAAMAGVSTLRATVAGWLAANDRASLGRFFSATELLRMGLEGARPPDAFGGWGNYELPLTGRAGAGALPDLPWERYAGRSRRMLALATPDLQITLALRLADLGFPPSLVPMLMASASFDLVNAAPSRHTDDWQAIVSRVQAIDQASVERYLGLLTTAGPLRADQGSSAP